MFAIASGENGTRGLVPKLQLNYEDSRNVFVSIGPSSQVAGNSSRVGVLESQTALK